MDSVDKSGDIVDKSDKDGREDRKPAEKPISLHPLKFEEALSDLLRVKPAKKEVGRNNGSAQKEDKNA